MLSTAEGLLHQVDQVTVDGLQEVFETNLFGHFVLVKLLLRLGPNSPLAYVVLVEVGMNELVFTTPV